MLAPLHQLSSSCLRTLAGSLKDGSLSCGITRNAVAQIVGANTNAAYDALQQVERLGMSAAQSALLVQAIADARQSGGVGNELPFELVVSGPEIPGSPTRDTGAVVRTLFETAAQSVLLVGYAVHNGRELFSALASRMERCPQLEVVLCIDIPRKLGDTSLDTEIVMRFLHEFRKKHWPWEQKPKLFYFRRSLSTDASTRASLHAKTVIVDDSAALITSANFTHAAQTRNVEVGVLTKSPQEISRLRQYFAGLISAGEFVACRLD